MADSLPKGYGFVVLSNVVAPMICSMYMGSVVMKARKTFNIEYPNLYAIPGLHEKADEFNRVQRGHQNMLESVVFWIPMSIIGGLEHPLAVAIAGMFYNIGCLSYQKGYVQGVDKRNSGLGIFKYVGLLTSLVCSVKFSLKKLKL